ncbi:hypothetical protein [Moraxella marmotae]|uniref:hypothetical protein n=1 Tax=Moraxella marmotae TaxID=3344520 RepID=UPI0035D42E63
MKSLKIAAAAAIIALSGCAVTTTDAQKSAAHNAGVASANLFNNAVKQTCQTQLANNQYWKAAAATMKTETQAKVVDATCSCVVKKAPEVVNLTEVLNAAINADTRATVAQKIVSHSLKACVTDTLNNKLDTLLKP